MYHHLPSDLVTLQIHPLGTDRHRPSNVPSVFEAYAFTFFTLREKLTWYVRAHSDIEAYSDLDYPKVFLDWYNTYPLRMRRCILTWEPSLVSFSLIVVFEKNETENWNIIFGEWSGCIIICLSLIAKAEVGFGCSNSSYLRSYFHSIRDIFFFSWSFSSNLDTPWVHFLNLTLAVSRMFDIPSPVIWQTSPVWPEKNRILKNYLPLLNINTFSNIFERINSKSYFK